MIFDQKRNALLTAACEIRSQSYSPYSNYAVGAAILAGNGKIYTGVNVENASYGLANCAERTAIFKMVTDGCREILAVAVCTENAGSPCGACRQVLVEFSADVPVYLLDTEGNVRETTTYALLPDHFGPEHLT